MAEEKTDFEFHVEGRGGGLRGAGGGHFPGERPPARAQAQGRMQALQRGGHFFSSVLRLEVILSPLVLMCCVEAADGDRRRRQQGGKQVASLSSEVLIQESE